MFWSVVQKAAEQAGKDLGVTVKYEGSTNDVEKQAQMIEAAVAEKPAGIAISLADPDGLAAAAKAVTDAKIPLYTISAVSIPADARPRAGSSRRSASAWGGVPS